MPFKGSAKLDSVKVFPDRPLGPSAKAWLVTERGSKLTLEEFEDEAECRNWATQQPKYYPLPFFGVAPCYVVFAVKGNSIVQVADGGAHPLAHATCAYHATRWLKEHYGV
jgi:hypothetical protein